MSLTDADIDFESAVIDALTPFLGISQIMKSDSSSEGLYDQGVLMEVLVENARARLNQFWDNNHS